MINLKDIIKNEQGIFSLKYLEALMTFPEAYAMENIAEFYKYKNSFEMTSPNQIFQPAKSFNNSCLIYLPSANFKTIKHLSEEDIEEFYNRTSELIDDYIIKLRDKNATKKTIEIERTKMRKMYLYELNNTVLYDASGSELKLFSKQHFTNGTKLLMPCVKYNKKLELITFVEHSLPKNRDKEGSSIFSLDSLFPQADFT